MIAKNTLRDYAVGAALAVAVVAAGTGFAWIRRTVPPWPTTAGTPYRIALGSDGCPIDEDRHPFVDAPGPLVPPNPVEVMLCGTTSSSLREPHLPRQLVLRDGASEFAALLNRLPDRNESWRRWQRKHSGLWPDPPPDVPMGEACTLMGYNYSFVLRYSDRPPVPLIYTCGGLTLTSGTRSRMEAMKLVDEFLRRFRQQQSDGPSEIATRK